MLDTIKAQKAAESSAQSRADEITKKYAVEGKWWETVERNRKAANVAVQDYTASVIKSAAAETAATQGIRAAWAQLKADIKDRKAADTKIDIPDANAPGGIVKDVHVDKMGRLASASVMLGGAFNILTVAGKGLLVVLEKFLGIVGIIIGAASIFDMVFGKGAQEAAKFKETIEATTASIKLLVDQQKLVQTYSGDKFFSVKNMEAMGTATRDVASQLQSITKDLEDWNTAVSSSGPITKAYEKSWDWLKGWFVGGTKAEQAAKAYAGSIEQIVNSLEKSPAYIGNIRKDLEKIIGQEAIKKAGSFSKALVSAFNDPAIKKAIQELIDKENILQGNRVDSAKVASTSMDKVGDAFKAMSDSFTKADPLAKFALESANGLSNLKTVLDDLGSGAGLDALTKLQEQISKGVPVFSSESSAQASQYIDQIREATNAI